LYDFSGSAYENELSVEEGDILVERNEQDGEWIEVERLSDKMIGYVPYAYIRLLPPSEAAKHLNSETIKKPGMRNRAKNTFNRNDHLNNSAITTGNNTTASQNVPPPIISQSTTTSRFTTSTSTVATTPPFMKSNDPLAFVDSYDRSERMFRQIMKQREEMFSKLEEKLNDSAKEVAHFQEKNEELIDRIKQLDLDIESERNRAIDSFTGGSVIKSYSPTTTGTTNTSTNINPSTTTTTTTSSYTTSKRRVGSYDKKKILNNN
jgi:hypothetical protein